MRGFFSFSLNEQATKEKKQKKVSENQIHSVTLMMFSFYP
ncbi:hypothetical protein HMPREF1218_2242 [Hoylesella pleuritidis F0068]|uniref:Uncharacterized protein n=1 Tax=Hoylesella pleuritidis F0068 TaxID=1081904 RepID=U2MA89_9BACT|nr:hypothetical protein HMPREF1218_2242 [Hoylesella pleuritidis F0068]